MEKILCETSSNQNSFRQRQVYRKITTRTIIPDESMLNNLMTYEIALRNGKNVDLYLEKLSNELNSLETIEPLLRTEIFDKLFAHFENASVEGKQSILKALSCVVKTNYKNIIATKYIDNVMKVLESFSDAENLKIVLDIIKELVEIDEGVAENILKRGGVEIILKAAELDNEEILHRDALVILFIVLFGGKNSVNILMKNNINKRMVKFIHIYEDKTINYFAYFALIYMKTIHKTNNEFFENGLMDNVIYWLSENEMTLHEKTAIDCNDKKKLMLKLLPLLTSKSRIAQTIGTFHVCSEITTSMTAQKSFKDANLIKALKRIAVYSNEFSSTLATNALIVLTNTNDARIKRFLPKPIAEWTCEDIQRWLKIFGFEEYAIFFNDVNGETFSKLKDKDLKTSYFMINSNVRKSFLEERSFVCDDIKQRMNEISQNKDISLAIENGSHKTATNEEITTVIEAPFRPVKKSIDVFISYRRRGGADLASLIAYHLRLKNYKYFLDVKSLGAGKFADELKSSIQKSANFLLLLTTDALERCTEENDWIRIEIEMALKSQCNIIPITRDFDNSVFENNTTLPDAIRNLKEFNQINWHHDAQEACLKKIEEYLKPKEEMCMKLRVPNLRNLRATRL
ncbi:hypothetical protein PVAND_008752 [Polypedilum vanderplanki]|uniref:ADP-ribosyl cyclase/cyclic ADP-ribose hydrolase n=1 Tax=Polypedilum vanderplanki TaxID=319348 RepID=A0A9J6CAR9_POLVA|nr:hypothetical protein PVAND_008752 [Polypedilum vanderplanki]